MGYQALLFCPDEKTVRTVTQVLSELEFNVESCIEPFAAVKKLMGQHFDAVVVDCDNEQNATLLFKSARNSTSNQASLAVAVVEGQAGVAKAFRIGANLVLTKPINIEQAKGTLRVARGLLRKSDPTKPAAAAPVAPPTQPVAPKPVAAPKPAAPTTLAAAMTTRAIASPAAKPVAPPAAQTPATAAVASSIPAAQDDVLEISVNDSVAEPAPSAPVATAPHVPQAVTAPAPSISSAPVEAKPAFNASVPFGQGSGAASAAAPAREVPSAPVAEPAPKSKGAADAMFEKKEASASETPSYVGSAPSFTFGGSNVPAESSGASKKIFVGIAAAAVVAVSLYFGWSKFQGHSNQPASTQAPATTAPAVTQQIPKPSAEPAASSPPTSQSAAAPVTSQTPDIVLSTAENTAPASTKTSPASTPSTSRAAAEPVPAQAEAPLIVKGGKAPAVQATPAAPDAPAPSAMEIPTTGAAAPPPDLGSSAGTIPKPMLQTLNISQGVSRGLMIKKVQPIYPKNALFMRIEGAVELMATISKSGDISQVKVLSGDAQLTAAAIDAVKQWKYRPYLLNGEPVEIQTQVTINFKLPK